jgi:spore maturation protein CgeB
VAEFGRFDLNILVDYGEDALDIPLDWEIPHPSAYWVSDAHLGYKYRMERAKQFDFVFVAQKAFIPAFIDDGIDPKKIFYLPHAFEPDVYKPTATIEKTDWCFVGHPNSEHRIDLLDRFIKEFPNYYLGWRTPGIQGHNELEDVNLKYNQSRLVINDAVKMDLNLRVFETLGAGRCLITQDIPEIDGEINDAFVTYKTIDEAVQHAKELLKDNDRRNRIARLGHEAAMREHTFMHRALSILDTCLNYKHKGELIKC